MKMSDIVESLRYSGNPALWEAAAEITRLREENARLQKEAEWQDISTAPKDGEWFETFYGLRRFGPPVGPMRWTSYIPNHKERYFFSAASLTESDRATHWRPLPSPPQEKPE